MPTGGVAGHLLASVPIAPQAIARLQPVLTAQEYEEFRAVADRSRAALAGRAVWCVNSTARGGGVAEMLRSLLGMTRGAGVDTRWLVLQGSPEFFTVTKRLHNRLHGQPGDGGPLGPAERAAYERHTEAAAAELAGLVQPGDIVVLHDPQTAGLVPRLRAAGIEAVVWRSHVGTDDPNEYVREAWDFLRPFVAAASLAVFSRARFVWDGLDESRVLLISPSIDVLAPKNQPLSTDEVNGILAAAGVVEGGDPASARFVRADGSPGRVDRPAIMHQVRPIALTQQVALQVSRWDRLKDHLGVMRGFVRHCAESSDAHLLLAGPETGGVADDPEAGTVYEEVVAAWGELPLQVRERVHLASLPMSDVDENAAIVNAMQRHAAVVVQKSLAEGFGLTVAEAMWKGRPLVASGVGGIQEQVIDRVTGLLVDPRDLAEFGHDLTRVLTDHALAARLGQAGRAHIREHFTGPRHLERWAAVVERLEAVGLPSKRAS